jgi:hypothetical protein
MALDLANMQVLAKPATSFYEGRAMRHAERQADQQSQLGDLQIERATLENDQLRRPQIDPEKQRQFVDAYASFGREAEARNLAQYEAEAKSLGEEQATALADERFQRDRQLRDKLFPPTVFKSLFPEVDYNPEHGTKWTKEGAIGAIATADDMLKRLATPDDTWTNPEAGVVNDREVMFRTNERTGKVEVLDGVSPRPQQAQTQILMPPQKFEDSASRAAGEAAGKAFGDVIDQGRGAEDELDILRTLRDNPAVTGPTQDARASASALFADLGIPIAKGRLDQIADLGAYKAAVSDLVLKKQLLQKGPQTESDAKRLQQTLAKTTNLRETNELVLGYQIALAERKRMRASFYDEFRVEKGTIDGADRAWREFMKSTPLSGFNKSTGRLVFFNDYVEAMQQANPEASEQQIVDHWKGQYGGR